MGGHAASEMDRERERDTERHREGERDGVGGLERQTRFCSRDLFNNKPILLQSSSTTKSIRRLTVALLTRTRINVFPWSWMHFGFAMQRTPLFVSSRVNDQVRVCQRPGIQTRHPSPSDVFPSKFSHMAPIGFSLLLLLRIYRRREMPSYGEINPIPFHTCLLVVLWISGWIVTRCPPSNECRPSIIRWIRPSSGRLKLNVDGAWNSVEAKGVLYSGTRGEGSWVLLLAPSKTSSPRHKSRSSLFELGLSW